MECTLQKQQESRSYLDEVIAVNFDVVSGYLIAKTHFEFQKQSLFGGFHLFFFLNSFKTHHKSLFVKIYYAILYLNCVVQFTS